MISFAELQGRSCGLNQIEPAIRVTEISFVPTSRKFCRQACRGVLIDVIEPKSLRPVGLGLNLIAQVIRLHPNQFSWSPYPTAANRDGGGHFDQLVGIPIRRALQDQMIQIEQWTSSRDWSERARRFLLY